MIRTKVLVVIGKRSLARLSKIFEISGSLLIPYLLAHNPLEMINNSVSFHGLDEANGSVCQTLIRFN
jgi:hypothetical protein